MCIHIYPLALTMSWQHVYRLQVWIKGKRDLIDNVQGDFKSTILFMVMFQSPGVTRNTCEFPRYQEIVELETVIKTRGRGNERRCKYQCYFITFVPMTSQRQERLGTLHLRFYLYIILRKMKECSNMIIKQSIF